MSVLLCVWVGCAASSSEEPPVDPGDPDSVAFAPFPGWPAEVTSRPIGTAARTAILRLALDPQQRAWVLHEDGTDLARRDHRAVLESYRADGTRERQMTFPAGTRVPELVVHASGWITVFVLSPDPATVMNTCFLSSCPLTTVRISPEGELSPPTPLRDADGPLRLGYSFGHVVAMADGEGFYLLAWTPAVTLYRVGEDGATRWRAEILPVHVGMAFFPASEALTRDDRGRIYVAYQIFSDDLAIYNDHFGRPPLTPRGSYDVLVQAFDPEGGFVGARLFGGPDLDGHVGLVVRDDGVIVVGSSRLTKYDEASSPNRTTERDLLVTSGRLDGLGSESYTTIDLSRDDRAFAVVAPPDGSLVLVGTTDFVQVDTNSVVENGKGMIATLSSDGRLLHQVTLAGPRDVQIAAAQLRADGAIVFAGTRDGPLTHTDPSEHANEGMLGVARRDLESSIRARHDFEYH